MKYRKPKPPEKMRVKRRVRIRVDGTVGNSGMKECVHYRCGNKIRPMRDSRPGRKYKSSCGTRISMRQPVEWYEKEGQIPKCPCCKARQWVRDVYRDQKELHVNKCNCNGLHYPHKKGTYILNRARDDVSSACIHFTEAMYEALLDRINPVPF